MGGHILRRLLGARWSKYEEVAMCNDCHRDKEAMANVQRAVTPIGGEKPSDAHFVHASESYEMTLHGRLVEQGHRNGVSCNQCHAPGGFHHGILPTEHHDSAVNQEQLALLCGSSGCHSYLNNRLNRGFLQSDMHDLDWVPGYFMNAEHSELLQTSQWSWALLLLVPLAATFMIAGFIWSIFVSWRPQALPILGGKRFERLFLMRKQRPKKTESKTDQVLLDRLLRFGKKRKWIHLLNNIRQKRN
jgi:sulfite reductase (NADPH) flavoprotein alpha-component